MRPLILLLTGFIASQFCFAQITGNANVRDIKAIPLDSATASKLLGAWKCITYVEDMKGVRSTTDKPEIILELKIDGTYTERRCIECDFLKTGIWQNKTTTIEFLVDKNHRHNKNRLEGQWAVYELTSKNMTLTRILTSSGDWKKEIRFERLSPNSPQ